MYSGWNYRREALVDVLAQGGGTAMEVRLFCVITTHIVPCCGMTGSQVGARLDRACAAQEPKELLSMASSPLGDDTPPHTGGS